MSELAILVTGGHGQLGRDLAAASAAVHAVSSAELDVVDPTSVRHGVRDFLATAENTGASPVMINAAAYTAVDAAETNPDRAFAVNAVGARNVAQICDEFNIPLIHLSTDYVFLGTATHPYEPSDTTEPAGIYGKSKLLGEHYVLEESALAVVVRTAWLYGATGHNFVKTMVKLEATRDTLTVVDDQVGSPTWTAELADGLLQLAWRITGHPAASRILHCTAGGHATWYEFARAIFTEIGADPERIRPCSTADYPLPAPRPAYSVLSDASWLAEGLPALRPWRAQLTAAFDRQRDAFCNSAQ